MKLLQIAFLGIFVTSALIIKEANSEDHEYERVKRSFIPYRTGKKVASQVSNTLDHF